MAKKVDCECGVSLIGENDDEIFTKVQDHAGSVHGMEVTREQALAMAKPA
jgi:predicted small metal-binding protein